MLARCLSREADFDKHEGGGGLVDAVVADLPFEPGVDFPFDVFNHGCVESPCASRASTGRWSGDR